MTHEEARKLLDDIRAQSKRTADCELHVFELAPKPTISNFARCCSCGWEPDGRERLAYEQGLRHGGKLTAEQLAERRARLQALYEQFRAHAKTSKGGAP